MIKNIFWFRTDLRLEDNHALAEATKSGKTLCIFIIDPKLIENAKYSKRLAFLFYSLKDLQENLKKHQSNLLIIEGNPKEKLLEICKITKAEKLFFNNDYSPFAIKRDNIIQDTLKNINIIVERHKDYYIFAPNEIGKIDKSPFKVFTAYKTTWLNEVKNNPSSINTYQTNFKNLSQDKLEIKGIDLNKYLDIYKKDLVDIFPPSFQEAQTRWMHFVKNKIRGYATDRSFLDHITDNEISGTSTMSPYIKFGLISIRQIVRDCINYLGPDFNDFHRFNNNNNITGFNTYLSEIIWREFYKMIIFYFPHSINNSYQDKFNNLEWSKDQNNFDMWCQGKTGYPVIDAAMIQLNSIGWMHNRARMIVASFLCKDLHINWKWGERYFYEKLIDYDLGSNIGGWQWTAGTGTDAAPYFRVFNPIEQGNKFDTSGNFIKKYLPQLSKLPNKYIHNPWGLSENELEFLGIKLGENYPFPIVNHKEERIRTLEFYKM